MLRVPLARVEHACSNAAPAPAGHLPMRRGGGDRSRTDTALLSAQPISNRVTTPHGSSSRADGAGFEPAHGLRRDLRLPTGRLTSSASHPRAEGAGIKPTPDPFPRHRVS